VLSARGIFMTGGKQACLVSRIGGTRLGENMRRAYIDNGACIAGTSAGASAISEHMLWAGDSHSSPTATDFRLVAGLGFVLNAVVDQHFSQRGRMSRLLAVIAYNPKLAGVGIDENTALAIARGEGVEVIGDGAVTLVDGHEIDSRMIDRQDKAVFQVSDVRVHLLPAGAGFVSARVPPARDEAGISAAMRQLVVLLAGCDAVDRQFHDGEARPAPTP
jgi:cyanophycinase